MRRKVVKALTMFLATSLPQNMLHVKAISHMNVKKMMACIMAFLLFAGNVQWVQAAEAGTEVTSSNFSDREIEMLEISNFLSVPIYYGYGGNGGNYDSGCFIYSIAMLLQNSGIPMTPAQVYADNSNSVYINSWAALNSIYKSSYNVQITDMVNVSGNYAEKLDQLSAALDKYPTGLMIGFSNHMAYAFKLNGEVRVHDPYNYNYENVAPDALGKGRTIGDCTYYRALTGDGIKSELVQFWGIDSGAVISDNTKIWAKRSDTDTNHFAVFYIDGNAVTGHLSADESGFFAFELDISSYSEGTHTLEIYYANSCGSSRDTITINIEKKVQFWGVENGYVINTAQHIYAKRFDDDVNHYAEFYMDGELITGHLSADAEGFFSVWIDPEKYSIGSHELMVKYCNTNSSWKSVRNIYIDIITPAPDTTAPIITDARIENISPNGYDVICTATDAVGVEKVTFVTWWNGTYDQIWEDGTRNGDIYSYHVDVGKHNNKRDAEYFTDIRAYDSAGNSSLPISLTATVPSNASTLRFDANGGTIVTETVTMTYGTGNYWDVSWLNPTKEGYRFEGWYTDSGHQVYDTSGFCINDDIFWSNNLYLKYEDLTLYAQWEDVTQPIILDARIENITPDGYDVICTATDNVQIEKVTFVTWWNGTYDQVWEDGTKNGDTYSYHVDVSKHNNKRDVEYFTDIRVYDSAGNSSLPASLIATVPSNESTIQFDACGGIIAIETITVTYGTGNYWDVSWLNPTKEGYRFEGWYTDSGHQVYDANGICINDDIYWSNDAYLKYEDLSLYARWSTSVNLIKNEQYILPSTCLPTTIIGDRTIIWTSSNQLIASVDENGKVTANAFGTATITAQLKSNPNIKATYEITVSGYRVTFDTNGGTPIAYKECGKDELLNFVEEPTKTGYAFTGWYKDAACTMPWDMESDVVNSDLTLYAGWMEYHEGLWIVEIPAQQYTGKAIKPEIVVYHYATKLEEGKDYKVSYKNNTNAANESSEKAPTVIVKGKGNYTGKETATFSILAKDISEEDVTADNIYVAASGKVQKPSPVVTWNNKKLKKDKDFTVEYPDKAAGAYQNNGTYKVRIVGKGNFNGERTVQLEITGSNLMSKAKVSKIANQAYTGKEIKPEFTVKYGSTVLTKGIDYTVSYTNNTATGTATAVLTGMGSYTGEKKVTFKIVGTSISKAKVSQLPESVVYDGRAVNDVNYQLQMQTTDKTVNLVENQDYTVSYKNNSAAGTATITFKGINGYSGTLKKTFKITAYDIGADTEKSVKVSQNLTVAYMKGSTVIEPKVTCFGKALKKGRDYTLTYKNNKSISTNTAGDKAPTVIISGKGNYSGKITLTYSITEQDIGLLSMTSADKVYQNATGKYVSKPVIKDVNGKKLSAGTDYEKELLYTYTTDTTLADGTVRKAGAVIEASDILPAGTSVTVKAKGKGNYIGELSCTYRIVQSDISKGKGKIATQVYTGKAIEPDKSDITLKVGKTTLAPTDYEIVSYSNNVRKGTATVVVKGVGNYGGTKTIKFKIRSKVFSWWWR